MPALKPWQWHRFQPVAPEVRRLPHCDWCDRNAPTVLVPADAATALLEPGADSWHRLCEFCRSKAQAWEGRKGRAA